MKMRWLAAPAIFAALVAGGGATLAAAHGGPGMGRFSSTFWSAVAAKLGIPASTLEAAVQSVMQQERSQWQAQHPQGMAKRPFAWGPHVLLQTAANYLGISTTQLLSDLRSGQSLAQIATQEAASHPNVSVSGLESALVAAETAHITQMVDNFVNHPWPHRQAPAGNGTSQG
jgi:hypothetical protein